LKKSLAPVDYQKFSDTFDYLYDEHAEPVTEQVLRQYALSWKKSAFVRAEVFSDEPEPVGAQIEALYELKKAREEGISKGLVVAATGVGKTYLSAFDSVGFQRVLFVAHREEILRQAEETFRAVRKEGNYGYYCGDRKDKSSDVLFATVQTLGNHLDKFREESFDYMVVDEFHHAAADSYAKILEHFRPKFLLGLTATPYRTDNRDIFVLCDDNVVYEIYLRDAINRGLLVPFRYYGIFDTTDYSGISVRNGQYVMDELEQELSRIERADMVLDKYRKMAGAKTMGLCASVKHAEYMAGFFNLYKVNAAVVHSGISSCKYKTDRREAVEKLVSGEIQVIFCVDIFNEGVDIPSLDTVLFLRPTESFVVFLQQLGRGLRKHEGKEHLTVLDFIGNYRRAHYLPALLSGNNPVYNENRGRKLKDIEYPQDCVVQFDFKVLDLFEEMAKADPLKKRMVDDYFRIKESLKRRPDRLDVFEGSDIPFREYVKKGWLRFLESVDGCCYV
jgi:superfamily II DNA or RNA helicase